MTIPARLWFPTILPGKLKRMNIWISFISPILAQWNVWHYLLWNAWMCLNLFFPIFWGLFCWISLVSPRFFHTFSGDMFYYLDFWMKNSRLQGFVLCTSSLLTSNGDIHGIVLAWWFLGYVDGLSVSLRHREKLVSSSTSFSVFFCSPQEPLKLSVPGNNYMFPRGSPNIQGIRRHLACKSLFLSLTLCPAFYFPSLLLSLSS